PPLKNSRPRRGSTKINPGLKILGGHPDGYHEIGTVYQTVALHDRLRVSLRKDRKGVVVRCDHPAVPAREGNLVYQACELWREARKFRGGISVHLIKQIPAGSGLGGASSDAAATLLGLERLLGAPMQPARRFELAARLGSDVPLFLLGGRVLGCGRGQEAYPLEGFARRKSWLV